MADTLPGSRSVVFGLLAPPARRGIVNRMTPRPRSAGDPEVRSLLRAGFEVSRHAEQFGYYIKVNREDHQAVEDDGSRRECLSLPARVCGSVILSGTSF